MNQLKLHKKIDDFIETGFESADIEVLKKIFKVNDDIKRYFYHEVSGDWITWLWDNGFLDAIKQNSEEQKQDTFSILEYLSKVSNDVPEEVARIILDEDVAVAQANFNPLVADRFLRIVSTLPVEQMKKVIGRIRDEEWVRLMYMNNQSGYEFKDIVQVLAKEKAWDELLELTQGILLVKTKNDLKKDGTTLRVDNPFYVHDIYDSGIFTALLVLEDDYIEKGFKILLEILSKVVKLSEKNKDGTFEYDDLFSFFGADFFKINIGKSNRIDGEPEMKNFIAVIERLSDSIILANMGNSGEVKRAINEDLKLLPESRLVWRLKLYIYSQSPEIFKNELKGVFYRLFEEEKYFDIESGAEYQQALKIGFYTLSKNDQSDYVEQVIIYFTKQAEKYPDQKWHKNTGIKILSSICDQVQGLSNKCDKAFGRKCIDDYKPQPILGETRGGIIKNISPVDLNDFTVKEIIENLQVIWTPEKINAQFDDEDFLRPRDVRGLGEALKEDFKKRLNDYLDESSSFFNRDKIDPNYLNSILLGIDELSREEKGLEVSQIKKVFELLDKIKESGTATPFKKTGVEFMLADWTEVHQTIASILSYVLSNKNNRKEIQENNRTDILNLIEYLFTIIESPSPDDEKLERRDLYGIAINSVRGRTYEAFVYFIENDGNKLARDSKRFFKNTVLNDPSLAVRFMVGRYLASFYYRDKKFIVNLLPEIFPKDVSEKKNYYFAAWEGYLVNVLYEELFKELEEYYLYAISLDSESYVKRKYTKDLDKSLGAHIALAFLHFDYEITDDPIESFWSVENVTRFNSFTSIIGRQIVSNSEAGKEWLSREGKQREKLFTLWDWILKNKKITNQAVFAGFGFWVRHDEEVLQDEEVIVRMAKTLKKSGGAIDRDFGLIERLTIFAEKNGAGTLEVIRNYLLDSRGNLVQGWQTNEIKNALAIIYDKGDRDLKQDVKKLINLLIEKGSSRFWDLKEIIK